MSYHVATVYECMRHLKAGYGAVASSEHAHQSRLELWVTFEEILHARFTRLGNWHRYENYAAEDRTAVHTLDRLGRWGLGSKLAKANKTNYTTNPGHDDLRQTAVSI